MSDDLTIPQQAAVEHRDGPLLVLAGPGSGKTRVITKRIARLIETGVSPHEILAITFTNKAAKEMAERVDALLPGARVWVSTFHRFCARLLRQRAESVGLQSNYTIYDTTDQKQLLRDVLNQLNIDPVTYSPSQMSSRISRAKNDMLTAEQFARKHEGIIGDHNDAVVARVFPVYQKRLLEANAVDFDDLLMHVVAMLADNPEIRAELDDRYRYVLVDEYQDTNRAQYQIVRALSQDHPNLCVTGDPDQSIYGWRGARIDNILRFEQDYPSAKVIRLEENFRSTKNILRAADSLIVHNRRRKEKQLITANPEGDPPALVTCDNGRREAKEIAETIRNLCTAMGREPDEPVYKWNDIAIVYRVNALSRELEQALRGERIPFQVAAGVAFYERAEIKDVLAYLQLVHNPDDYVAFRRVVNKPTRGIGKTTQTRLLNWAESRGLPLLEAARQAHEHGQLSARAVKSLHAFAALIDELAEPAETVCEAMERVINRTRITEPWIESEAEEDMQRLNNVQELLSAVGQYDESAGADASLEGFLETTSLVNDVDGLDETGSVTLMTMHAAKGLEFPVVFIVAVEQNLIPHERSLKDSGNSHGLEEERRLLFVAITRAEKLLYLTRAVERDFRGRRAMTIPSDFLREMDLADLNATTAGLGSLRAEDDFPDDEFRQFEPEDDDFAPVAVPSSNEFPKLMTGNDLLRNSGGRVELPQGFGIGERVRHPQYGTGTVRSLSGMGRMRKATVEFRDRTQTFVISKCPLQPVGGR